MRDLQAARRRLDRAQETLDEARAELYAAIRHACDVEGKTEVQVTAETGLSRMTVRKARGK